MLNKAAENLDRVLQLLSPTCQVFDDILEALSLIKTFSEAKNDEVIRFVMEHYTTEQIVKRCEEAVIVAFAKDYQEFMNGKKGGKDV